MVQHWENLRPATKEKWLRVAEEWRVNGYNSIKAYRSVYPNVTDRTARDNFSHIKRDPFISKYIEEQRSKAFENRCIDLTRVTEEISEIAFCEKGDEFVPMTVKLKALELLQKALKEDELARNNNNEIVIGLEEDEDESNTEENII